MLPNKLHLRVAGPTILVSLLLLALCCTAALYFYFQQASSADVLDENVSSSQAAFDLENTLHDLIALLRAASDQVEPLHKRFQEKLADVVRLADKPQEQELAGRLQDIWKRYQATWNARATADRQAARSTFEPAIQVLEREALPTCHELQRFNTQQVKESGAVHQRTSHWLALGLIGVGTLGSFAGLVLGYSVARAVRHSIYHLSVRVQDAANKLGQDLPQVSVVEDGDLHHLHTQMQGIAGEIEQVVQKLQQRDREVLRAEQLAAVGQLAAGVAHELRNPLTSIKMLVQTNREDADIHGQPTEDYAIIEHEIRRMERCLQSFLDFARPPRPERRPLDLCQPIEQTLALIAGRARKQHVTVRFQRPPRPVVVEADGEQLQQVFINLALNSLDVLPHGGLLVVDLAEPASGQVEVRVYDSGPGIAADILPRIFQPFVTGKEAGLGLGLVISQRIAESHGGSLHASNRAEGGACFVLRLPVQGFSGGS